MTEEKEAFIPLTSDSLFKAFFRNKKYLIYFLKDILKEEIIDLEYLDTYLEKESYNKKENFLDLLVKYNNGNYAIVEMQNENKGNMITRIFYYLGKLATRSLKKGEEYKVIKKYIGICVLNYQDKHFTKSHNTCKLYNETTKKVLSDILEVHVLNLKSKEKNEELKWIEILKEEEKWDMGKYNDEELKEAVRELKRLSGDVEIMAAYDKEMEDKLDRILIRQEALENAAINLAANGVTKEIICKSLNITPQELDNILKNN